MKAVLLSISVLAVLTIALGGCRPAEKDVTQSSRYPGFSSFRGTVWRTKVKLGLAEVTEYTGAHHIYLVSPEYFDPMNQPTTGFHIVGFVPAGTHLRIKRLIFDTGEGSILWVVASLDKGDFHKRVVYVQEQLLRRNIFLHDGMSRRWGVNPKYLESDAPPRKAKGGGK